MVVVPRWWFLAGAGRRRVAVTAVLLAASCSSPRVAAWQRGNVVEVRADGEAFATVHADASPRPFVWPVLAAGGIPVTRAFPMAQSNGEPHDHPHHQSLWFGHGAVAGRDFWHAGHGERLELTQLAVERGGDAAVAVIADYRWVAGDPRELVLTERRIWTFGCADEARTIDLDVRLRAGAADVVFGDTKEGTFALRLHPALQVAGQGASGNLRNSAGDQGDAVWGRRARWIDDCGSVDGRPVGVALFDHPDNLRHPTFWHARSYGLLAANPFGVHDFTGAAPRAGDYVLAAGAELHLRYRVLLHGGHCDRQALDAAWSDWAAQPSR